MLRALRCGGGAEGSLLTLYKTHILPVIIYGATAVVCSSNAASENLERAQNQALRMVGRFPPGSKQAFLLRHYRLKTIQKLQTEFCQNFYRRARQTNATHILECEDTHRYNVQGTRRRKTHQTPLSIILGR